MLHFSCLKGTLSVSFNWWLIEINNTSNTKTIKQTKTEKNAVIKASTKIHRATNPRLLRAGLFEVKQSCLLHFSIAHGFKISVNRQGSVCCTRLKAKSHRITAPSVKWKQRSITQICQWWKSVTFRELSFFLFLYFFAAWYQSSSATLRRYER